jgi:hypothetical protein
MTSKKIDLLEQMKRDEEQLKLRQKELAEEIELDIHRQNLLEQSGTINKLKTQLDLFRNKIMEEEIAPNNYKLLVFNKQREYSELIKSGQICHLSEEEIINKFDNVEQCGQYFLKKVTPPAVLGLVLELQKLKEPHKRIKITSREYFDNISKCNDKTIEEIKNGVDESNKFMVTGNFTGSTKYDMVPILTTILGVLDKQQQSIETINKRLDSASI